MPHPNSLANLRRGETHRGPAKLTADVRQMIVEAFEKAGGVEYLARQAEANPQAFMALLGKILPKDVNVTGDVTWRAILEDVSERSRARQGAIEGAPS